MGGAKSSRRQLRSCLSVDNYPLLQPSMQVRYFAAGVDFPINGLDNRTGVFSVAKSAKAFSPHKVNLVGGKVTGNPCRKIAATLQF